MIAIVLGILKWIGILLLVILGLVLAIMLIVLLVPIRYRLQGARSPEDGKLTAGGKVSWLLSILAVTFAYDQEFSWKVRIFGIPLKLEKTTVDEDDVEDLTEKQLAQIAELEAELEAESKTEVVAEVETAPKHADPGPQLQTQALQTQEPQTGKAIDGEKVPLKEKLRDLGQKISQTMHSIPKKIAGIKEKIRSLKEKADIWIAFIKSDEVKQLLAACKKQIRQILRHLIPAQFRIQGNYGFEDPSLTGKITGFLCALPPKFQKNIHLQPHFQEECLDGEVVLKGRIRLGSLLWPCILIVVKPCTWKVYKRYKAIIDPKPADSGVKTSVKGKKSTKATKKKSGKTDGSHKKKAKNTKNDPHKGGK